MSVDTKKVKALIAKIRVVEDDAALKSLFGEIRKAAEERPVRLGFVNAHAINFCYENEVFLNDLGSCDYLLRDGAGMKILFKLLKREAGLNLNGTDLIPRIIKSYKGKTAALLGTDSPYLEKARDKIAAMDVRPVLLMDGYQEAWRYPEALNQTPADLVILAMGMPKQEYVASLVIEKYKTPSLIVCGGAILDFMGGKVKRAPEFFRKSGSEWLYRLSQEPVRLFNRYVIGNFVFLWRALSLSMGRESVPQQEFFSPKARDPKKILHVVRQYYPSIGGLESYVRSLTAHQKAMGYDCEILTLNRVFHGDPVDLPAQEVIDGINVRRVAFSGRRRFFFPKVEISYFKKFDIVHVHNTDMFYDYVGILGLFKKIPAFATTHGGFFHTKDFSIIKKIYFNVITRFTSLGYKAIFAISQNDFDTFEGLNQNVLLLPNAIEPLGNEISTGKDFLYIGRLARHKNLPRLIEVYAMLRKKHSIEGNLHIIGPEWDVKIDDLKAAAKEHGVTDTVIFHGAATQVQMKDIAYKCGYFMSASTFEGFGMSMLEAMSVGLIPFVHENESFRELVWKSKVGHSTNFDLSEKASRDIAMKIKNSNDTQRKIAQDFARGYSWLKLTEDTLKAYRKFTK